MTEAVLTPWQRSLPASVLFYVGFMRLAFLKFLAYRLRYYTGVISYTVFMAGNYYLYTALFASRSGDGAGHIGGLTLDEMITYVAISWIGRSFYFNNIERTLAGQVQKGEIVVHLVKPFHIQTVMLCESLGESAFRLLMFTVPIIVVIGLVFHPSLPAEPALMGWTLLSFLLAFLVNAQISFLVGCMAFFLKNINGLIRSKMITMEFLTGVLVPFTFFPDWFQSLVTWMPFQAVSYIPVTIYLGRRPGTELYEGLLLQLAWAVGLLIAGRFLWALALRRVSMQGG